MYFLFKCLVAITWILCSADSEQRMKGRKGQEFEGFIVRGKKGQIESFPYAVYMSVTCEGDSRMNRWRCGASILNQQIFLTAAHCFDSCQRKIDIILSIGNAHRLNGLLRTVKEYRIHQHYRVGKLIYDIALLKGRSPITFNRKVNRVAIMRNPPYFETAEVSGWGYVDEKHKTTTDLLHYTRQRVIDRRHCKNIIKNLYPGTVCAQGTGYASLGDSGSALVVRGYIQIGLVSYKNPNISRKIIVYTDVGHYYSWIVKNAKELLCE